MITNVRIWFAYCYFANLLHFISQHFLFFKGVPNFKRILSLCCHKRWLYNIFQYMPLLAHMPSLNFWMKKKKQRRQRHGGHVRFCFQIKTMMTAGRFFHLIANFPFSSQLAVDFLQVYYNIVCDFMNKFLPFLGINSFSFFEYILPWKHVNWLKIMMLFSIQINR